MQQSGGAFVMDVDATAALHHKGIAPTDDKFKFTWFEVRLLLLVNYFFPVFKQLYIINTHNTVYFLSIYS